MQLQFWCDVPLSGQLEQAKLECVSYVAKLSTLEGK